MKRIPYDRLQETLYYEQMENGLDVFILPKPGFLKTYAIFATKYGSIDNHFRLGRKEPVKVPDGIAHFLEHKMFEEPTGDVFATFSAQGASANAYTSFDRTAYLFSATDHIAANVETLLDFVQNPYFTDESVEKEKGIIEQEINMYQDNPDWRVYHGLIEALYQKHPVRIDIAGTVESIYQINKELLYECYHTFYHPSNMALFIVGGVDAEKMMEIVRANQAKKKFEPQGEIERIFEPEPPEIHTKRQQFELSVSMPKCMIGFKEAVNGIPPRETLERELEMRVLLDMLFSSSSKIYEQLYDEKLITDSFGYEYVCNGGYAFSIMGGDTQDPDRLADRIRQLLDEESKRGLSEEEFEHSRRKKVGAYLRLLNSPESIAGEFIRYRFRDLDFFEILPLYESLTFEQVEKRFREHFDWERMAMCVVTSPQK